MICFLCIGAQKAGTTALHNLLRQHPDICLPAVKEIYYFSMDRLYRKGTAFYHSYFKTAGPQQIMGEIAPDYLCSVQAPKRIAAYNPAMKLIIMLRDPVDRAYSQYLMKKRNGREKRTFSVCVEQELTALADHRPEGDLYSYVSRGLYATQLKRYRQHFSKEQLHVLLFEDFIADQQAAVKKIFSFLGVDPEVPIDYNVKSNEFFAPRFLLLQKLYNAIPNRVKRRVIDQAPVRAKAIYKKLSRKTADKEQMDAKTRARLVAYYQNDRSELEKLLQIDLYSWDRS